VSPQYSQLAADCGTSPPVLAGGLSSVAPAPQLLATNSAARFLAAAPCGPDGKPLEAPAAAGVPR
jgi:hypothetical protein